MSRAWIGLGANLGDRPATLRRAVDLLAARGGVLMRVSHLYETRPEGGTDEPPYLNGVAEIETALEPAPLLALLQGIERELGRPAGHAPGPRTCDLDLLAWSEGIVDQPGLQVPHPRLPRRGFVLVPMCELDVHWRHPVTELEAGEMLAALALAHGEVRLFGPLPLPVGAGPREQAEARA